MLCDFNDLRAMTSQSPKVVLTIAGFDPSSGAGVTADLKTVSALGHYGTACITAVTVQTTLGVLRTEPVKAEIVRETLEALMDDTPPAAVKVGMLGTGDVAAAVAEFLRKNRIENIVLDPVLRSSSGAELLDAAGIEVLRRELIGLADVITPNLAETHLLTGEPVNDVPSMELACRSLGTMGAKNVVITGGHLEAPIDVLGEVRPDGTVRFHKFAGERIQTRNTHGTGCAFSTAIACGLVSGERLAEAVFAAKVFVTSALRHSYPVGRGAGPINHFWRRKYGGRD